MGRINFGDSIPYMVQELICVKCGYRYIGARPVKTKLRDLECAKCRKIGYIITTGEILDSEDKQ